MAIGDALLLEPELPQAGKLILHACNSPQGMLAHIFDR
jgi:hypothetical protein